MKLDEVELHRFLIFVDASHSSVPLKMRVDDDTAVRRLRIWPVDLASVRVGASDGPSQSPPLLPSVAAAVRRCCRLSLLLRSHIIER